MGVAVLIEVSYGAVAPYLGTSATGPPPGMGIGYMALLDGLVLFSGILLAAPLVITHQHHAKLQGFATLIVGLITLVSGIVMIVEAITKLMLMAGFLMAIPFGTIVYMAKWAGFDRPSATAILSLLMMCKLGFAICLVLAHEGILKNKFLIVIIISSLLANIILSFLHGLVPGFLVSITDAIGGIIVAVLALIWALFFLIGSIISIIKVASMLKNVGDAVPTN